MPDAKRGDPMKAAEKAFKRAIQVHRSNERERQAEVDDAATEAKIARLKAARLARDAEAEK